MLPGESETGLLLRALDFAARKHRDQRRKGVGAVPYINHPISVARLLSEFGGVTDTVVLVGAVLHDTVEDTQTTLGELDHEFGAEVRDLVAELTDDKNLTRAERKRLQEVRAPSSSTRAKLIKLADKISNVVDIVHAPPVGWSVDRRREYLDWTERVVAGCRGVSPVLEQLYDEARLQAHRALAGVEDE